MQVWRTRDSGHFILANYHHSIDESYKVLWVERTASRAATEEAVDYWVLVWFLDCAQQGKKIGVTGLVGVDMDASVDRVLAKLKKERDTRLGGQ